MCPPRFAAFVLFGIVVAFVSTVGQRGVAAPVPKHLMKAPETDKAKFQGKWRTQSILRGGNDILPAISQRVQGFDLVIEFRGDRMITTTEGGGTTKKTTVTVKFSTDGKNQLTTVVPPTVHDNGGPVPINMGREGQQAESTGYAFDGEKLLLGTGPDGLTAIDPLKPGKYDTVIVLVRVK